MVFVKISRLFLMAIALFMTAAFPCPTSQAQEKDVRYIIVTDVQTASKRDSFADAVNALAELRKAKCILRFRGDKLKPVFARLQKEKPDFVAFIVHPQQVEANFAGRIFQAMTAFDGDPLLDCAYGFITGATGEDALALVRNTAKAETERDHKLKKFTAVGHTFTGNDLGVFAKEQASQYAKFGFETAVINPIDDSKAWEDSVEDEIRKLNGSSLIFLAGHGTGDVSCAIPGKLFGSVRLKAAVVVNGTCHSAVTIFRYDSMDRFWNIKRTEIDPRDSVGLNLIKAGAVGQFGSLASSSWTNVGFTINHFFREGITQGEALQRSLNAKLLSWKVDEIDILPFKQGIRSPQAPRSDEAFSGVQSISRVILIGDPAYRPFPDTYLRYLIHEMLHPKSGDPSFAALNEIISKGSKAVPLLLEEMKISNDWRIPKALGGIGDSAAVESLIHKLTEANRSPLKEVISEALERITGEKLGADAEAWKEWWEKKLRNGSV